MDRADADVNRLYKRVKAMLEFIVSEEGKRKRARWNREPEIKNQV